MTWKTLKNPGCYGLPRCKCDARDWKLVRHTKASGSIIKCKKCGHEARTYSSARHEMQIGELIMPYIRQEQRRPNIDALIGGIREEIRTFHPESKAGAVNYVISRIVAGCLEPQTGWRYTNMNEAMGVFESAKQEFYRRIVAPYEDAAIEKNGDIEEYAK